MRKDTKLRVVHSFRCLPEVGYVINPKNSNNTGCSPSKLANLDTNSIATSPQNRQLFLGVPSTATVRAPPTAAVRAPPTAAVRAPPTVAVRAPPTAAARAPPEGRQVLASKGH